MKKRILTSILALFVLCTAFVFSACSDDKDEASDAFKKTDYMPSETVGKLTDELDFLKDSIIYVSGGENLLDEDYFDLFFGDSELLGSVVDYAFLTSSTTDVSEVGIFKMKDEDSAEAMKSAIETRKETLITTHTNYDENNVKISEGMKIESFGDIVWFAATTDNNAVAEIIKK